uniref:Uncharacterized protein n=1 Tax=Anguilla anguilla TaxID=7936 RepID=A0A0E9RFG2_ANGAN
MVGNVGIALPAGCLFIINICLIYVHKFKKYTEALF